MISGRFIFLFITALAVAFGGVQLYALSEAALEPCKCKGRFSEPCLSTEMDE